MYVLAEQKLNRITNAHCYYVCPTYTKPNVGGSAVLLVKIFSVNYV